nr:RpiB/LacA/LacB family sugar-phosphate isomerase [Terrabacter sp. Root181]
MLDATLALLPDSIVYERAAPPSENYAWVAREVCHLVKESEGVRGFLVCGTGIGMAITANRISGVRAAVCHDIYSVERSILSNDCQVLCMGARVIAPESAARLLQHWMTLTFQGDGPSAWKVGQIDA